MAIEKTPDKIENRDLISQLAQKESREARFRIRLEIARDYFATSAELKPAEHAFWIEQFGDKTKDAKNQPKEFFQNLMAFQRIAGLKPVDGRPGRQTLREFFRLNKAFVNKYRDAIKSGEMRILSPRQEKDAIVFNEKQFKQKSFQEKFAKLGNHIRGQLNDEKGAVLTGANLAYAVTAKQIELGNTDEASMGKLKADGMLGSITMDLLLQKFSQAGAKPLVSFE